MLAKCFEWASGICQTKANNINNSLIARKVAASWSIVKMAEKTYTILVMLILKLIARIRF